MAKTSPGDGIVFDPFLGSGTTLIAAERLGRSCRGIELEPRYVAVTLERFATMTGQEPRMENGRQEDA
jgi:DNA modification methylase